MPNEFGGALAAHLPSLQKLTVACGAVVIAEDMQVMVK
jgi:hypothetical protein